MSVTTGSCLHRDCKSVVTSYVLWVVSYHQGTVGGGYYPSFAKHDLTGKSFDFGNHLVTQVSQEDKQISEA